MKGFKSIESIKKWLKQGKPIVLIYPFMIEDNIERYRFSYKLRKGVLYRISFDPISKSLIQTKVVWPSIKSIVTTAIKYIFKTSLREIEKRYKYDLS